MQLNHDQEFVVSRAVDWFKYSSEQLFQYDGPPGSGKSVVLNEIVNRLGLDIATEVAPMSFIGAASLIMRTKGLFTAKTAHSWIFDVVDIPIKDPSTGQIIYKRDGHVLTKRGFMPKETLGPTIKLIIIDEAFCMPRTLRPYIERLGVKILACGDQNQLPPVKDYPAFLVDGKIHHLSQIMRQEGRDDIIFISNRAMHRQPLLNGYYGHSMVVDREDLSDEMLLWADMIICGTNRTRDIINDHIRYLKGYNSLIPQYGERLVCRNNNWDLEAHDSSGVTINLVNGLIGTVVNHPGIDTFNERDKTFKIDFLCDYVPCQFKCNANYDYIVSKHAYRSTIKDSPYSKGQMLEYAYAITCHIAQGSQFEKVLYIEEFLGEDIQSRLNLVGATRATKQLIYVNMENEPWPTYDDPTTMAINEERLRKIRRLRKKRVSASKRRKGE